MPIEQKPPAWFRNCPAGQLTEISLNTPDITVQAYVARGTTDGPTLVVLAGVHGDEYEGPVAIAEVLSELTLDELSGTLLAVPIANPPAYGAGLRSSPLDGVNLARCFPGDPEGTPSQQLSHLLTHEVIQHGDAMIDLHSAGVAAEMALLVGYPALDNDLGSRSRDLAVAFGAPVIWQHPTVSPGRTLSAAIDLGIPCVYTEATGGGGALSEEVECYVEGVQRVMISLGMIAGEPPVARHRQVWRGEGDTDAAASASRDGLFRPAVCCGDEVQPGDLIGELLSYDGQSREPTRTSNGGVVAMIRRTPRVEEGDGLFLLTSPVSTVDNREL